MREIPLQNLMQKLYENEDYFASISIDIGAGSSEKYHKVTIHPDDKERYLLQERGQWLSGVKGITDYLDTLSTKKMHDIGCGLRQLLSYLDSIERNSLNSIH